ncbi:metallophosphoesterase family protein [Affinirhizobium pseudoryzae]|uniref:metallophosphoesterase family protein n=1 Tax=Allorhizobium pseudoryzae TaxID=379684 RepID=UPI0013EC84B5|nr:metallophosphoesterase family protein [Allorhizobium pseudoryzae]
MISKAIGSLFGRRKRALSVSTRRRLNLGATFPSYPIYAIGDVHGCLDLLQDAEERILLDMERRQEKGLVVLLGDYVDRGPNSAGVLAHLIAPNALGLRRLALCGNHDDVFSSLLDHPETINDWLAFGGRETLMSYGIDVQQLQDRGRRGVSELSSIIADAVPERHIDFLKSLPVSLQIGPYLFVHAGIRPGVDVRLQEDRDLMWIREPFLTAGSGLDLTVIHGHTPSPEPSVGPARIGIDTQAYSTGRLTVLRVDKESASVLG